MYVYIYICICTYIYILCIIYTTSVYFGFIFITSKFQLSHVNFFCRNLFQGVLETFSFQPLIFRGVCCSFQGGYDVHQPHSYGSSPSSAGGSGTKDCNSVNTATSRRLHPPGLMHKGTMDWHQWFFGYFPILTSTYKKVKFGLVYIIYLFSELWGGWVSLRKLMVKLFVWSVLTWNPNSEQTNIHSLGCRGGSQWTVDLTEENPKSWVSCSQCPQGFCMWNRLSNQNFSLCRG